MMPSPISGAKPQSSGNASITSEIQIPPFSGEAAVLTMVPTFPSGDPRNTDNPRGQPGQYRVTIVLGRPGSFEVGEREFRYSDHLSGNSHLAITPPANKTVEAADKVAIRLRTQTPEGSFIFDGKPNEQGYLGKLISQPFEARNFEHAIKGGYHAIAASLSNWSAHLDVPFFVAQIDALELRTGAASLQVIMPPLEVILAVQAEPKLESEFRYYASLYREALNTNSPFYRFLCLYKIIEGVRLRRARLAEEARASDTEPQRFDFEAVPDDSAEHENWLNAIYGVRQWDRRAIDQVFPKEIRGQRFSNIVKSRLTPLRNEVAHGILDTGELGTSIDDMTKLERVNFWLPLTRTIVRRLLKNSFRDQFMGHMPDPAGGKPKE
jgi:hypothetical protein